MKNWPKKLIRYKVITYQFSYLFLFFPRLQPLTLADLCRIHIRHWFGERLRIGLDASSLPQRVVRFLMLEDVEIDLWHDKTLFLFDLIQILLLFNNCILDSIKVFTFIVVILYTFMLKWKNEELKAHSWCGIKLLRQAVQIP